MDKMSSAHVYVRMHKGQTIDNINEGLLEDCAQLVKANSIQGKPFFPLITNYFLKNHISGNSHHKSMLWNV